MKTEHTNIIRKSIKSAIENIRECRKDKSIPCLLGCGWTIAVRGQITCIEKRSVGYSFFGMWNRRSIYWGQETAIAGMREIQANVPFDLEVIHKNDLRDRHEQVSTDLVKTFFQHRNKA